MVVKTLIEVIVVVLIGYGIWHEDKLVEIEDKIYLYFRKRNIERIRRTLH